jgi:tetratricopeptide (TPR) repeat protein
MQKSNQIMLIMAGTFAGIGVLTMLIMTWFQWRMSSRLAGIAAAWPAAPGLTQGSTVSELAAGDSSRVQGGSVAQPELRLLPAIEQLKKRIHGLEQGARAGLASGEGARSSGGNGAPSDSDLEAGSVDLATMDGPARVAALLREARARLNADDTPAALACLDKVLALAPNHGEALVKKGAALERLHRLNEAIECYDRAIAADGAMTIAYLHKGGLCKRLERFKEALECYEEALRRHDGCSG